MNLQETTFADAGAMLEACRSVLEKSGFQSQANALRGLEVLDATGAEVALATLKELPPVSEEADMVVEYAITSLTRVFQAPAKLAS